MFTRNLGFMMTVLICGAFAGGNASASVVPVLNPSFEITSGLPDTGGCLNPGCAYNFGPIPDWTTSGSVGSQALGSQPGALFNYLPDGNILAFSNGGTISQIVGTTTQAGDSYTLTVFVGNRTDGYSGTYQNSVDLLIDGTSYYATGTAPTAGNWSAWTATGTAAASGQSIKIQLGPAFTGSQADYDSVSLTATPEPGVYGVLALGLSGLVLVLSRRRKVSATGRN